jgi:ribosome-associated translation inhibitor RaiA
MAYLRGVIGSIGVLVSSSISAATLTVDLNGGADHTDIQAAIDAAADDMRKLPIS